MNKTSREDFLTQTKKKNNHFYAVEGSTAAAIRCTNRAPVL